MRKRSIGSERTTAADSGGGGSPKKPRVDVIVIDDEEEKAGTGDLKNGRSGREEIAGKVAPPRESREYQDQAVTSSLSSTKKASLQPEVEGKGQGSQGEGGDVPTDPRVRKRAPQTPGEKEKKVEEERAGGGRDQMKAVQAEEPKKQRWKVVAGMSDRLGYFCAIWTANVLKLGI